MTTVPTPRPEQVEAAARAESSVPGGVDDREALAGLLAEHGVTQTAEQGYGIHSWRCGYPDQYGRCDCLGELLSDLTDLLSARDERLRREGAATAISEWADWIESGTSAAGLPESFTLHTVLTWMRSGRQPFGVSAAILDAPTTAEGER